MSSAHDFSAPSISGQDTSPAEFKGKTLLGQRGDACGLTPQHEGLQALHAQYAERGLPFWDSPQPIWRTGTRQRRRDSAFLQQPLWR